MYITTSYEGTTKGEKEYLFFLLYQDYIEAESGLPREINSEIERFARVIGQKSALVRPFSGDADSTMKSVLEKNWSKQDKESIYITPAILMINVDFDSFDPAFNQWLHFPMRKTRNDVIDKADISRITGLLSQLANIINQIDGEGDAFEQMVAILKSNAKSSLRNSIELRPSCFGLSIDLREAYDAFGDYFKANS